MTLHQANLFCTKYCNMTLDIYYSYCLSKKGATEHFPFDQDTLVFKVGDKIFELSALSQWEKGNLKCEPEKAQELRAEYTDVQPGYHMNKIHWNTIVLNNEISDIFVKKLIDHSYELVFKSLNKKLQRDINALP